MHEPPINKRHKKKVQTASLVLTRISEFIIALGCLLVFSPLFLICACIVFFEDGTPVFYKQERIGYKGQPFQILKFRTMKRGAESDGQPRLSGNGEDDPRLLRAGRFLRKHHLDELPQLWNVLRGDMAFVGPRPEREFYVRQIMARDSRYERLYQVRPGVTSYATLYNGYTDTMEKMLRRLELDIYYLDHQSLRLNVRILWLTFCKIVSGSVF